MGVFRKASASDSAEALETAVSGCVDNEDGTYSMSLGDVSSWAAEVDFITYARDEEGAVDEATRVVWTGIKEDIHSITVTRVGGNGLYVPSTDNVATVVPTHYWVNDFIDGISATLPADGLGGVKPISGLPLVFSVGATQPSPVAGRTVVWLKPLV